MPKVQVLLQLAGKVEIDATYKNTINNSFINYLNQAFQGQQPLIKSYQIYESINNVTVPATITKTTTELNQITITLQALLQNLQSNNVDLHLQAVLTNNSLVEIASVSTTVQVLLGKAVITWTIIININTFQSGILVNFFPLYQFLLNFFTNSTLLKQQAPQINVTPTPYAQNIQGLSFTIIYNNYQQGGNCPIVVMTLYYILLGNTVLSVEYGFICTPSPSLLNFFEFSLNIS
ncbi:hypothetical protein SFV1gp46 [Sulfolobus filamentous virus 1]|uniref:Uncharacterized protein n=1 Tax=Sulfolobus filamentous virus 1 TaxID=2304198 RepID=A0A346LU85_SUFV1|nr:hypothetical protein HOT91_gp46 [Sulfolobus filamentous virus 1]AXQ00128.1 hypothetical protein SFV1gp46 [Sulfolobus filamentous virus 1]